MKFAALFFLAAMSSVSMTSCEYISDYFVEELTQDYVTPENVALAATAVLLHEHPDAEEFLAQIEVEFHDIALADQITVEEIYTRLDNLLPKNRTKYKKATMAMVRMLLNKYEKVLNTDYVDLTKYANILLGFADGIDQALYIYAGDSEPHYVK